MYIFYVLQARAQTAVFVFCLFFILQELHVFSWCKSALYHSVCGNKSPEMR